MNRTFHKQSGDANLEIKFFWKLTVETKSPAVLTDHLIPELFFDYLFVKEGKVKCIDQARGTKIALPQQTFKSIHTHALTFIFPRRWYCMERACRFGSLSRFGGDQSQLFLPAGLGGEGYG